MKPLPCAAEEVTQRNALFQECFCLGDRAARIMGMSQVERAGSTVTLLFRKLYNL